VSEFEKGLLDFLDANYRELLDEIKTLGEMSDKAEKKMKKAVEDFKKGFSAS
jgi:F0F1-type ATP synthase alpha subunit